MPVYNAKVVYSLGQDGPYTVPFPFISEDHLLAEYDGLSEIPVYDAGTNTCVVAGGPSVTTPMVIRRVTPKTPIVNWVDNSTLDDEDLDLAALQWQYVTEELEDKYADVVVGAGGVSIVAGNSYTGSVEPTGDIQEGFIWFKQDEDFRMYRWNGSAWIDVQKVLDESDFGTGVEPVRIVGSLPADNSLGNVVSYDGKLYTWDGTGWSNKLNADEIVGQLTGTQISDGALAASKFAAGVEPVRILTSLPADNSGGNLVALTTDGGKLYRWNGSAWTKAVPVADLDSQLTAANIAADAITSAKISAGAISTDKLAASAITADKIAANAIVAAKIAAGSITADKVASNEIITTSANIGFEVVDDSNIGNLAAGKITTGFLAAQHLALASDIYDPSYTSRRFAAVSFNVFDSVTTHNFGAGDGFTFTHHAPIIFYTQGSASGTPVIYRKSDASVLVSIDARIIGYTGIMTVYILKTSDPGNYIPIASENTSEGKITCFREIPNIAINDTISFYVGPCDGSGDPTNTSITKIVQMDIVAQNWR